MKLGLYLTIYKTVSSSYIIDLNVKTKTHIKQYRII